jgi:YD repeat-containing protein
MGGASIGKCGPLKKMLIQGAVGQGQSLLQDLKDRLTDVVDEEGHTTRYFYDANDRLIKEVSPSNYNEAKDDGEGIRYFYNWKGNLTKKVSPLGETLEETIYDAAGNVKAYTDEQGRKREYAHNSLLGRIIYGNGIL